MAERLLEELYEGKAENNGNSSPLLGEEGWLRIKKYREASFESADGVVRPE